MPKHFPTNENTDPASEDVNCVELKARLLFSDAGRANVNVNDSLVSDAWIKDDKVHLDTWTDAAKEGQ